MKTQSHLKRKLTEIAESLTGFIFTNRIYLLIGCAALIVGITAGCFTFTFSDANSSESLRAYMDNFFSAYPLLSAAESEIFKLSLLETAKTALILWLSGLHPILMPLGYLRLLTKGLGLGFTLTFLISHYGGRGLAFGIISILPQNIIAIPAMLLYAAFCASFSVNVRKLKQSGSYYKNLRTLYAKNLYALILFCAALFITVLIDSYIAPTLIKPFCSFFAI